jgi:hypothetical protein
MAVDDLIRRGEVPFGARSPVYTRSQLLDDWWPDRRETPL